MNLYKNDFHGGIKELLTVFEDFIIKYRLVPCTEEWEIKKLFITAKSIEDVSRKLSEKNLWPAFSDKLSKYLKVKRWTCCPEKEISQTGKACDIVLCRFLRNAELSDSLIQTLVSEYLNAFEEDRFKAVIEKLTQSRRLCMELCEISDYSGDTLDLEVRFISTCWIKQAGSVTKEVSDPFHESTVKMLSKENGIPILFNMLFLEDKCDLVKVLKRSVASSLSRPSVFDSVQKHMLTLPREKVKAIAFLYPEIMVMMLDSISSRGKYLHPEDVALLLLFYKVGGPVKCYVVKYVNNQLGDGVGLEFFQE